MEKVFPKNLPKNFAKSKNQLFLEKFLRFKRTFFKKFFCGVWGKAPRKRRFFCITFLYTPKPTLRVAYQFAQSANFAVSKKSKSPTKRKFRAYDERATQGTPSLKKPCELLKKLDQNFAKKVECFKLKCYN